MKNEIVMTFTKWLVAYGAFVSSLYMFLTLFLLEVPDTTVFLTVWSTAGLLLGIYNQQTKVLSKG